MTATAELLGTVRDLEAYASARLAKAAAADTTARDALVAPFAADLADYFAAAGARALATVRKAVELDWDLSDIDWILEESELRGLLARWYATIGETAFAQVAGQLAVELRFDVRVSPGRDVLELVGNRVAGITETSRQVLESAVRAALESGESVDDVRAVLGQLFDGWSASRAQTIALTETAYAYNRAALAGYAESGLMDSVLVFDGTDCGWTSHDDPDLADGTERTLADAEAWPISHPNCQRALGPVVAR